jgi:hypothetical protein
MRRNAWVSKLFTISRYSYIKCSPTNSNIRFCHCFDWLGTLFIQPVTCRLCHSLLKDISNSYGTCQFVFNFVDKQIPGTLIRHNRFPFEFETQLTTQTITVEMARRGKLPCCTVIKTVGTISIFVIVILCHSDHQA